MKRVYLDNAATSYPKPPSVIAAMNRYMGEIGASVGRSSYAEAASAEDVQLELRLRACRLFNFDEPSHVIITPGATWGLNMIIRGFLKSGDHVLVSSLEHNAVMRPLNAIKGLEYDVIPADREGVMNNERIEGLIRENTRALLMLHASNVSGCINDVKSAGEICRKHGLRLILDASQSAGHIPVDFKGFGLSAMAVPGHKGLMGPQGIGLMLLDKEFAKELEPVICGGTGSASDMEYMPEYMPDRFEAGTPNIPGIFGLNAALKYIEEESIEKIRTHEYELVKRLMDGISAIPEIRILGSGKAKEHLGVVSISHANASCDYAEGHTGSKEQERQKERKIELAALTAGLEREYGICVRCGLHCAPSAHKTLGSFPDGALRFSIGYFNTPEDIDYTVEALKKLI